MTIRWNEVTIWWNEVTKGWNEVAWNEVVMERSDRNSLDYNMMVKCIEYKNIPWFIKMDIIVKFWFNFLFPFYSTNLTAFLCNLKFSQLSNMTSDQLLQADK